MTPGPGALRESLRYLFLPGVTLGVPLAAYNARIMRSAMIEVLGRTTFVRASQRTARAHVFCGTRCETP